MRRLTRSASRFGAVIGSVLFTLVALASASAAERSITLLENTDLPGFDYSIHKDVTLEQCREACEGDRICRAFTYNEKADWCFLKGEAGEAQEFEGATSGTVTLVPAAEATEAVRQTELPFPAQDLIEGARHFARSLPQTDPPPPDVPYAELVAAGHE